MKEYYGKSVKNYRQPTDKHARLFPAIERIVDQLGIASKNVLDLGCGDGVLYPMFHSKNVKYTGVDISKDMINQAEITHSTGNFVVGSATELPESLGASFDLVIANMLFPSIGKRVDFKKIFTEVHRVLNNSGYFVATIMNPCFDGYMQKMLFDRKDIESDFKGYYTSPTKYVVRRVIDGVKFTFEDYHWQLSDYLSASNSAGFQLHTIDECIPVVDVSDIGGPSFETMLKLPNFLVLVFKK